MSADLTQRRNGQHVGSTGFWAASRLVAEREIKSQVRTKAFWLTFGLFVVGIFAMSILPGVFGGGQPTVATVGSDAERVLAAADFETRVAEDPAAAEELVRSGEVDAAVVPDANGQSPTGVRVIGLDGTPDEVVGALSVAPPVDVLEPSEVDEDLQGLVSFLFALTFFAFAIGFGMAIAQNIVTEKQTRIVEILVATVPVRALLAGKISGYSLLVFAQVAALALITPVALRMGEQTDLLSELGGALGWFVPFFILGFVLLATLWAVAGSVVSRQEDLGSSSSVVMALIMAPYIAVVLFSDNDLVMTVMSYVPFSAPVAMPARMFAGNAQTWEPFVALVVLGLTLVGAVLVASRLYSGSLLQSGSRVRLSRAWSQAE